MRNFFLILFIHINFDFVQYSQILHVQTQVFSRQKVFQSSEPIHFRKYTECWNLKVNFLQSTFFNLDRWQRFYKVYLVSTTGTMCAVFYWKQNVGGWSLSWRNNGGCFLKNRYFIIYFYSYIASLKSLYLPHISINFDTQQSFVWMKEINWFLYLS